MKTLICFILFLFLFIGCDPFRTKFDEVEEAILYEAVNKTSEPATVDTLLVMTWNIKFAGGRIDFFFDCYGNRTLMKEDEVIANLKGLAKKINQVNPDIVLMQEVDVESKRCDYIDNLQWLLDNTDLNYGAYASQWKADYVPSDGIGRVNSGNAIMSRWKITDAERIALPLISDQDALTQYFYLRRNILKTKISVPGQNNFHVLCVHTSAFSKDGTKQKQIDIFKDEVDALEEDGFTFIAGGDLNTLPPNATKRSDFPDSKCEGEYEADDYADDYTDEKAWLSSLFNDYSPAVSLTDYIANEGQYYTHSTSETYFWNRKLDYLFTNGTFVEGLVHQNQSTGGMATMPLSDHAPVTAKLVLGP